jgi:hypothetical protein
MERIEDYQRKEKIIQNHIFIFYFSRVKMYGSPIGEVFQNTQGVDSRELTTVLRSAAIAFFHTPVKIFDNSARDLSKNYTGV